jgi:diguanylate cyclase (GGDEF)-like protein
MAYSRDKTISGIICVSSLAVTAYLLLSLPPRTIQASTSCLDLSIALIYAFNAAILFGWFAFGGFGGIPATALAALFVVFFALRADLPRQIVHAAPFLTGNLIGYLCHRSRTKTEQWYGLKAEKLDEEINVITNAITRKKTDIKSLEGKLAGYSALKDVAEAFSTKLSLDDVTSLIVEKTHAALGGTGRTLLFLVDTKRQELELSAARGASTIKAKNGDIFDRWVLKNRKPLIVEDMEKDFKFPTADTEEAKPFFKSLVESPLMSENKVIGILRSDNAGGSAYTQDDLRLIDIIASLSAVAIQNAFLYERTQELAIRDGLTGLYLRRYFLERLREETKRAAIRKHPFSLLFLDIDHFKKYNDKYGHTSGDLVLKHLARKMTEAAKEGDMIARYGGEEMAMLLLGISKEDAVDKAESIRRGIEDDPLILRRQKMGITVSIGVASYPKDASMEEELMRMADERLYKAKASGRNRVCSD